MYQGKTVAVVVPALNEAESIGTTLSLIPDFVDWIVVGDNASVDNTAEIARSYGAEVVYAENQGYGSACLAGLAWLRENPPDIVVFSDADGSDDPGQMAELVKPLLENSGRLILASRALGTCEVGALSPQQRFGNWLACNLIFLLWSVRYSDLGPYRALSWVDLEKLEMSDPDFGWTVEMQIKAARLGFEVVEIPANYRRRRQGESKVGGSWSGSLLAAKKILYWIFKEKFYDLKQSIFNHE